MPPTCRPTIEYHFYDYDSGTMVYAKDASLKLLHEEMLATSSARTSQVTVGGRPGMQWAGAL